MIYFDNGKTSNNTIEIKSTEGEFGLCLSDFIIFDDKSSVKFKLFCRSSYFEIRNFDFFADFNSFKTFLQKTKTIYEKLDGVARIETSYEKDIVSITGFKNGSIGIHCEAY